MPVVITSDRACLVAASAEIHQDLMEACRVASGDGARSKPKTG